MKTLFDSLPENEHIAILGTKSVSKLLAKPNAHATNGVPPTEVIDLRDGAATVTPAGHFKDGSENAVPDASNVEVCIRCISLDRESLIGGWRAG